MGDSSPYPRVLVVGQAFNRTSGGGITLSNLFGGWPSDRLACALHAGQSVDQDVCEHHYVLGRDEAVWRWPLSLVRRKNTSPSGVPAPSPSPAQATGSTDAPAPGGSGPAGLLYAAVDALGIRDEMRTLRLSDPLRQWVREFDPQVVYSLLGDLPTMGLVGRIADEFAIPVAVHMMDDWPATLYRSGVLRGFVRRRMDRDLRSLLGRATALLAISDAMAQEYAARYGRKFRGVHNPVDLQRWDALATRDEGRGAECATEVRLMYAGRVARANTDSIVDVAHVVSDMETTGTPLRMDVYTGDWARRDVAALGLLPGVRVHQGVSYDRIPALMHDADVLLLPLDFDTESAEFVRLSMPTKVSEYLAAGRPTLTYAPAGSAATEYARSGGWSVVVDRRDPAAIGDALDVLADGALRREMGAQARLEAERVHDSDRVREAFRSALAAGARAEHA